MHQICNNGVCQCQLNPSCSSVVECTETNTAMQIGTITLECKSQYGLFTDCENGRCQCFQNISSTTTAPTTTTTTTTTVSTAPQQTTASTAPQQTTTSTAPQQTTTSTAPQQTTTSTAPQQTTTSTAPQQTTTTTRDIISPQQTSSVTIDPSTPAEVLTVQPITNAPIDPNAVACASRMDCNQQNTHAKFLTFAMPCPVDHIDCVDNKCFCSVDKITTTTPKPTTTTITTPARSISCHQCGDPDANLPCDLRTVYMGQSSQCSTGSYCMTDVVQGSDDSVAIYKRCVDELTCRNEWLTLSSDQDRCVRYAEGAVPGQYKCHYCCTVDGCNSKVVPEAKYLYSTFTIEI
ncbi:salivary glue protein Sgs-3 [Magallana gigas]|uniref:salivary glue protein Sgs-3 n=1 Tax=Magallana gigas TaxID=29159 RepID=UPI00333E3597